jgi:hypothetical protein
MDNKITADQLFMGLVYSLTQSAFIGLGKLPDPVSGKIEQNLEQASQTIDLLGALLDKTKGNLSEEEENFIRRTVSDLRLNYVDEVNKAKKAPEKEDKKEDAASGSKEKPKSDDKAANEDDKEKGSGKSSQKEDKK